MVPNFYFEQKLFSYGYRRVCGLDEAGRGAWAGPLVAAAVVLPGRIYRVRDSKTLKSNQRTELAGKIKKLALDWAIGVIEVSEINRFGLGWAAHEVFRRAIHGLHDNTDHLLVDYLKIKDINIPQISIVDGDQLVTSIAAASILAKSHRDSLMRKIGRKRGVYCYRFAVNKGYGTAVHQQAIKKYGLSPYHRLIIKRFRKFYLQFRFSPLAE